MKTRFLGPVLAVLALCGVPATGAILSLNGPASPVVAGNSFMIDVSISGVTDLASYQFDVGYNPLLVSGMSVQEGAFLPAAGSTLFVPGFIDDTSGTISFTAGALIGIGPGATGTGILARLQFAGLAAGAADFSLISPLLYNSIPDPIEVSTNGVSVTIDPTSIPEPVTAWLAACGLGLFVVIRRRA